MRRDLGIALLILLFLFATGAAFYFDESYRRLIRNLYQTLSDHKISFRSPGKYFHFASGSYTSSFGLFVSGMCFLLYQQKMKQTVLNLFLAIMLFTISIYLNCYLGAAIKLVECTACNDGTRIIHWNDINYDRIFISSLIISALPTVITGLRKPKVKTDLKK